MLLPGRLEIICPPTTSSFFNDIITQLWLASASCITTSMYLSFPEEHLERLTLAYLLSDLWSLSPAFSPSPTLQNLGLSRWPAQSPNCRISSASHSGKLEPAWLVGCIYFAGGEGVQSIGKVFWRIGCLWKVDCLVLLPLDFITNTRNV